MFEYKGWITLGFDPYEEDFYGRKHISLATYRPDTVIENEFNEVKKIMQEP